MSAAPLFVKILSLVLAHLALEFPCPLDAGSGKRSLFCENGGSGCGGSGEKVCRDEEDDPCGVEGFNSVRNTQGRVSRGLCFSLSDSLLIHPNRLVEDRKLFYRSLKSTIFC